MRTLSAAVIAIALSVVACGGANTPTTSPTPSATATVSPTAGPTTSPTQPASTPSSTAITTQKPPPTLAPTDSTARLIYTTGPFAYEGVTGPLWISDIAASRTLALTPDGVSANFAGITGDPLNGTGSVYYVAGINDDTAEIYRINFPAGAPEHVLDFTPWNARFANASLSPDERYIAYSDRYGLQLLDLHTYHVLMLAKGGDHDGCLNPQPGGLAGRCLAYSNPVWSPDGSLMAMRETFYEGGDSLVLDPFSANPQPTVAANWAIGGWSADSQSICSSSDEETAGLQISRTPDWARHAYLASYVDPATGENASEVSCAWLDAETLAIGLDSSGNYPRPDYSFVATLDIPSGTVTRLAPNTQDEQCCGRQVFAAPDAGLVLTQYLLKTGDANVSPPSQPEAIDIATGQAYSLLQPGDWIVAVVSP